MRIIGEKINGTRRRVAEAILARDISFIQGLARAQADAGAAWLDVNAGTHPAREPDDLVWLVEAVQAVVEVPLCLDSANSTALEGALGAVARTPLINSVSGEAERLNGILPLAIAHGCPVVALAMDSGGIPAGGERRMEVIRTLMTAIRAAGLPESDVYVDPLVMAIATDAGSAATALEVMRRVRVEFPAAHLTVGLSNISFGLPARSLANRGFLTLAIGAGLDTAILDPLDRGIRQAIVVAELLAGRDRHCLNYLRAARSGLFDADGGS